MSAHALIKRLRRKARAAHTAWDALAASPHDLSTGPLVVAGQGRLGVSHSAGLAAGEVTVTHVAGRRQFTHPALAADQLHKGDHVERGARVTVSGVPAGTLTLWAIDALSGTKSRAVATLVIS